MRLLPRRPARSRRGSAQTDPGAADQVRADDDLPQTEDTVNTEDTVDTEDTVELHRGATTLPPLRERQGAPDGGQRRDPDPGPVPDPDPDPAEVVESDRTVRAARRRFVRRRWARRWLAWRRVVAALLLAGLLVVAVWLVFFSSVLAVSGVQVEGTGVLASSAVRRAAEVPTGTPLATVDLDSVSARVEGLPAVKSVDVSRAWPNQVRIDVTERRVVAVVAPTRAGGRLRGTDAEGVVFRSFAARPPGMPLIRMGQQTGTEALAEAAGVAGSLPAGLAAKVADVSVRTVDTIALRLRDGRTVRWGSAEESVAKARVLAVLLTQKASFYDVSVPGQPILRR